MKLEHNKDVHRLELQITDRLCLRLNYLPWTYNGYLSNRRSYSFSTPSIGADLNVQSGEGSVHFFNIKLILVEVQLALWTGQQDLK